MCQYGDQWNLIFYVVLLIENLRKQKSVWKGQNKEKI